MKFTLNQGVTDWAPNDHPFDFPGSIETYSVTIQGRGAGRIHEVYRAYENDLIGVELMDEDDLRSPEGRIAVYLYDYCMPIILQTRGKTVLHVHWEDPSQAEQFMKRFAKGEENAA